MQPARLNAPKMDDYRIEPYTEARKEEWDAFVEKARNATFLFKRGYMDYHADRFRDHSLMVYRKGKLYALLPANRRGDTLHSHQGLTYGGLVMSEKTTASGVMDAFRAIHECLKAEGIRKVVYKALPCIYHRMPSQEDLYALFRLTNARLIGRSLSSTLCQESKPRFAESRKSGIRKATARAVTIRQSDDYAAFWEILEANLQHKYGVAPVHTLEEIRLLAARFPENIRLHLACQGEKTLGGTVMYLAGRVAHTQYISASPEGKAAGALDLLFDTLINREYADVPVFDFGSSTEDMGRYLNESLLFQKENFGGRGMVYDVYEYDL